MMLYVLNLFLNPDLRRKTNNANFTEVALAQKLIRVYKIDYRLFNLFSWDVRVIIYIQDASEVITVIMMFCSTFPGYSKPTVCS